MDDDALIIEIHELVDEEHRLQQASAEAPLDQARHDRLERVEAQLDQCWDLLRQRRARRHAGQDPEDADARPTDVVERYQQ